MTLDTKKIHLIKRIMEIEDEALIEKLEEVLEDFPSLTKEHILAALAFAARRALFLRNRFDLII